MFLENTVNDNEKTGWIEVICGSMFSGKTEELIRRLRRAQFAKQKVEIFKPSFDTRYDDTNIVSHNANEIPSTPVEAAASIMLLADGCDVVGIDEAQFFDDEIVNVCNERAKSRSYCWLYGSLEMKKQTAVSLLISDFGPWRKPRVVSAIVGILPAVISRIFSALSRAAP